MWCLFCAHPKLGDKKKNRQELSKTEHCASLCPILPSRELNLNSGGNSWQNERSNYIFATVSNFANRQYPTGEAHLTYGTVHKLMPGQGQLQFFARN